MRRRTSLRRTTRLSVKTWLRAKTSTRNRQRDTGPTKDTRDLVKERANWTCERCGQRRGEVIHHRDPRGAGGSSRPEVNEASNLVFICVPCHTGPQGVENKRLEAIGDGFLIPDGLDPKLTRVRLWHGTYYLTDSGDLVPHKDNAEEAS